MKIIGLVGPKGSGKDTANDLLVDAKLANGKISFAGPLKEICSKVFNIPIQVLNDPVLKEQKFGQELKSYPPVTLTSQALKQIKRECAARLPEYDEATGLMTYNVDRAAITGLEGQVMSSPRELMQIVGTEFIRERIFKGWHREAAFSQTSLSKLNQNGLYCVTDVRFADEYRFLKEKFGDDFECFYIERPSAEKKLAEATHPSELGVKEIRALLSEENVVDNSGSIEEFQAKLEAKIKPLKTSSTETPKGKGKGSKFVYGRAKN